ncbi:transglycosylase domain-containing protein [Streptomyces sp. TRM 70351]|nr:transglycosylase domain-containing protein [Streptomyces sp. TRM 70351]MEE1929990.1 transglycosylase domain-containing protein [Streptomyces sp. TRM 70351]
MARKRFIDYPRSGRNGVRRWVPSFKQIAGACIGFLALILGLAGVGYAMVEVPDEKRDAEAQNNIYYWADGTVMARDGKTNRQIIDISNISTSMQGAVIAAENATFYQDQGIDPKGIARAVVNMASGGDTQGGSTITQQFVKNTYLTQEQTVTRKVKELFMSIKVNSEMKKPQILQGYLNTAYYGRGAYGIQAAAQAYYGVNADELTPTQSALLATVLKGPALYDPHATDGGDPVKNHERAVKRWRWVLDRMVETGELSQAEREKYQEFPEPLRSRDQADKTGQTGYLIAIASAEAINKSGIEKKVFDKGGFQIYTTFEKDKVEALEKTVTKVREDNLDPEEREVDNFVQFGAASVVPDDGRIVALYGGEGFDKGHFLNNANTLGVPVGSTWKPFVLAAAMEHGTYKTDGQGISPDSYYNGDNKLAIRNPDGSYYLDGDNRPFRQVNLADKDWGDITLRRAMEVSANSPFVQLGMDVGMDKVRDMALAAGLKEESINPDLNPSFALGTSTPSAIRMADAYATFAASGTQTEPYSVTRVVQGGSDQPGFEKPKREQAIDADVADNVTEVLRQVVEGPDGSGRKAAELNRPVAGKTGTTDNNESAWWVGYTPQLSTAVTMFRADPDKQEPLSMYGVGGNDAINGGALPTEVWTEYMRLALDGEPVEQFPEAQPIGEEIYGGGAESPEPSPTETEEEPEETPEPDPTPSEEESPELPEPTPSTPSPSDEETCNFWEPDCDDGSNGDSGHTDGGPDGQDNGGAEGGGQDPEGQDPGGQNGSPGGESGETESGGYIVRGPRGDGQ